MKYPDFDIKTKHELGYGVTGNRSITLRFFWSVVPYHFDFIERIKIKFQTKRHDKVKDKITEHIDFATIRKFMKDSKTLIGWEYYCKFCGVIFEKFNV